MLEYSVHEVTLHSQRILSYAQYLDLQHCRSVFTRKTSFVLEYSVHQVRNLWTSTKDSGDQDSKGVLILIPELRSSNTSTSIWEDETSNLHAVPHSQCSRTSASGCSPNGTCTKDIEEICSLLNALDCIALSSARAVTSVRFPLPFETFNSDGADECLPSEEHGKKDDAAAAPSSNKKLWRLPCLSRRIGNRRKEGEALKFDAPAFRVGALSSLVAFLCSC